jgi:hypothetical protein
MGSSPITSVPRKPLVKCTAKAVPSIFVIRKFRNGKEFDCEYIVIPVLRENSNITNLMRLLASLSTQMSGLSSWSVRVDLCWLWHMDRYFSDYPVFLIYSSTQQRRHKI